MNRIVISSFLFLLFFAIIVSASYISLSTTISDITIDGTTQAKIKLTNSGDESAFNLLISLMFPSGFEADEITIDRLYPNVSFEGNINITRMKELIPGRYPVVVSTKYTDANGYLFSAVSHTSMIYKTPTVSKVTGNINELTLGGNGKLVLNLRNIDNIEHEVNVKLFLPRELNSVDIEKFSLLGAGAEKRVEFEISNNAALEGSSYVVLASVEYTDNLHYSSFANGVIKIESSKKEEMEPTVYLFIGFVAISSLIIFLRHLFMKKNR